MAFAFNINHRNGMNVVVINKDGPKCLYENHGNLSKHWLGISIKHKCQSPTKPESFFNKESNNF
jgi:hypothetical protein